MNVSSHVLYALLEDLTAELGAQVRNKKESRFMRVLGTLLFFNPLFMTSYTTTIGNVIYFPRPVYIERDLLRRSITLAHELVHVRDFQQNPGPLRFVIGYLFPQILAVLSVFSLLAVWFGSWWLFCLLWLLALLPWPAPWRAKYEFRGYAMTMAVSYWSGYDTSLNPEKWVNQFVGPGYWFMSSCEERVRQKLEYMAELTREGKLDQEIPLAKTIHQIVKTAETSG